MASRCFEQDEIERLLAIFREVFENTDDEGEYGRRRRRFGTLDKLLTRCSRREGVWRLATDDQVVTARALKARLHTLQGGSYAHFSHDR